MGRVRWVETLAVIHVPSFWLLYERHQRVSTPETLTGGLNIPKNKLTDVAKMGSNVILDGTNSERPGPLGKEVVGRHRADTKGGHRVEAAALC